MALSSHFRCQNIALFEAVRILRRTEVLLLSNSVTGDRSTETNGEFPAAPFFFSSKK